jgi:hypothetical protein
MSLRLWVMGAYVEADGVKVVGFLSSKRAAWADIDRFEVLPSGRYPYVGHVVRRGGHTPIVIRAMAAGRTKTEKHRLAAQEPVDLLNEVLNEWRLAQRP